MFTRSEIKSKTSTPLGRENIRPSMTGADIKVSSTLRPLDATEIKGVRGGYTPPGPNCKHDPSC